MNFTFLKMLMVKGQRCALEIVETQMGTSKTEMEGVL